MGADYPGQEKAIKELKRLSKEAKEYLNHHICNAITAVLGGIHSGDLEMAKRNAWHIIQDLEKAGIREKF
jgi:hypothetical protein